MPYNPGVSFEGPRYLMAGTEALGRGLQEAVAGYAQGKAERQQLEKTALMYATALREDADAVARFGGDFAKIPDMTLGRLKGFLGGVAAYHATREWQRQEREGQRRMAQSEQEMDLNRLRMFREEEALGQPAREAAWSKEFAARATGQPTPGQMSDWYEGADTRPRPTAGPPQNVLAAYLGATEAVPGGAPLRELPALMHYQAYADRGLAEPRPYVFKDEQTGTSVLIHGRQAVPLTQRTRAGAVDSEDQPVTVESGGQQFWQDPTTGKWALIREPAEAMSPLLADTIVNKVNSVAAADAKVAELQGKVAQHGPEEKVGPNWGWTPFKTYGEQLSAAVAERNRLQAELDGLRQAARQRGAGAGPAGSSGPGGPAGGPGGPDLKSVFERWKKEKAGSKRSGT
jgi:hypothetical protein